MDHLSSQVVVGAPADPSEPRLAAGRVLPWHQPDPGGKFPSGAKVAAIGDAGDQRGRDDGTNAWQRRQPVAAVDGYMSTFAATAVDGEGKTTRLRLRTQIADKALALVRGASF